MTWARGWDKNPTFNHLSPGVMSECPLNNIVHLYISIADYGFTIKEKRKWVALIISVIESLHLLKPIQERPGHCCTHN